MEKRISPLAAHCVSSFGRNDDFLAGENRDLVGAGGGFAGFYFLEEPDDSYAEETEEGEPAEDVYEGPVGGLALELPVHRRLGGVE